MSDNVTICEKCGETMTYWQQDSSCGMKCPKCGWGWATTYFPPIMLDETIYKIQLQKGNPTNKDTLKIVSKFLGCNYIAAKKAIETAPIVLLAAKAPEIKEKRTVLDDGKIEYEIIPSFPY